VQESSFNASANHFITEIQESPYFEHSQLIHSKKEYNFKQQTITLSVVGKEITPEEINYMQALLHKQYGLENATLVIRQSDQFYSMNENELIEGILEKKDKQIEEANQRIKQLEADLAKINAHNQITKQVAKEIAVQYPNISSFAVVNMIYTNTKTLKTDTIPTLFIESTQKLSPEQEQNLLKWLRVRLEQPKLRLQ